ncbi:zinc finger protein ZFAT-like isoform X5 [Salvelinus fontinalis]|uniref:zinc finger protein ZFAT-like isoform X5 n=1 Tax=Salvelinus fontinalis TaxID=8038 RepID=UPI0024857AB8|nr:zinc finger protein ZFAT-like isoform X5 [Salvelinus fontinalis]
METSTAGGTSSIFMCKLCNLFSPHRAQLLSHVSEKHHTEGLNPDDIIVALMPLTAPLEKGGDSPVKRKRGRPKGSTKKIVADGPNAETTSPNQKKQKQQTVEAQSEAGPVDEEEPEDDNALDCKKCNRVFGNRRQIMKHICLIDLREDEDQEEDNDKEFEAQPGAAEGKEEDRERSSKRPRPLRSEKVSLVKEQEPAGGTKNPIISVVLTAHEALPGATRIVPIEATPAEPVATADTDPQEAGQKRGFQEYSIQQAAYEVPLKSNRIGQTQLKIFTCEYCNKVFKFRHSLQAHLRTHTNEKPFKCPHCDYASAIKANLSVHMRKHTGEKFSCEHCSFQCLSKGHLKVHVERVHHKIKQHCLFCKKKYSDVKNLLKHMRESHDLEDKKVKDSYHEYSLQTREGKRQLLYDCQICDRKFKNELDRDRHMMVHGSERPFGCELCDHGCTKFQALQAHVRKHPFLYVCAACQQKFVSSVRLKAHLKEAHPESEEAAGFSESINSSFCLLEPGDDIKREMLRQDEIRMAEELSLLNAQQDEEEALAGDPSEEQEEALAGDPSEEQEEALAGDPSEEQEEALAGDPSEEQEEALAGDPSEEQEEALAGDPSEEQEEALAGDPSEEQEEALAGDPSEEQEEALAGDPSEEQEEALAGDPSEEQEEALAGDPSEEQEEALGDDPSEEQEEGEGEEQEEGLAEGEEQGEGLGDEEEQVVPDPGPEGQTVETCVLNQPVQETETLQDRTEPISPEQTQTASKGTTQEVISEERLDKTLVEEDKRHGENNVIVAEQYTLVERPSGKEESVGHQQHPEEDKSSSSTSQGHVEETLRSLVLIQGEVIGQTNASAGPQGEDGTTEERSAFQQILDKLQKRQLNMVVFDRIRKVYGDLECEYCGKLFWYQVHYNMHVRTHTKEHLHYCTQCSYSSITKNCLKRHLIQRHSNILLQCPMEHCQYCTPDKYKLQAHLKTHFDNEKKSFACPVCEETFTEDKLKHHIKNFHPDTPMNTISETLGVRVQMKGLIGKRASKCPYCDSYFMRNGADLQQHIWAHQGVKPFKCSLCDYASRSKSNLKAHMSRHTTEKTHLCDMCGKKFKSKVTLKSHKLMHTEDGKQFKCTECDYSAAQRPLLVRHMEQHASFKPYRCGHCHYSCNIAGPLKRHYSKKHPNQEYCNAGPGPATSEAVEQQGGVKCPVCDYVYGTKWEMNRHLKNKHGLKVIQSDVLGLNQWEVVEQSVEEPLTQYLHITETEDPQGTEAAVSALQDLRFTENGVVSTTTEGLDPTAVNILQQIIELGAESNDATAASMVAMVPGRVTVVEQVTEEEEQGSHTVMIQDPFQQTASMGLGEEHHLVVSSDDVEGMETVTVYTQGEDASQFIVYVQEAVQTEEHTVESI